VGGIGTTLGIRPGVTNSANFRGKDPKLHSQTKVGRKRSIAVLLAGVVALTTFAVAGSPAGAVTPLPGKNPATCSSGADVASANIKWSKPVPSDDILGYIITISPGSNAVFSDTPPPFAVSGVDTLTAKVLNLVPGKKYTFTVQSTNADGNVNGTIPATSCGPEITIKDTPPVVATPYVFGQNRDTIIRHFQEFLQRDPNFSELAFWDRYFFNSRTLIGSCGFGGYGYNNPIQFALDTAVTSKIGPFCASSAAGGTQSGPEIDLINFLIFGEDNAAQPFDTGGQYDNYDRKTYAGTAEPITRLYLAYFGRVPEFSGFKYWYTKYKAGRSLSTISDFFAKSSEFDRQYGELNDSDYVTLVYLNVLARNEDFGGQNFWRGQLEGGLSRGEVMTKFSESNEYKRITNYAVKTIIIQAAMLGTTPTKAELDTFVNVLNGNWSIWCIDNGRNEVVSIDTNGSGAFKLRLNYNGDYTSATITAPATAAKIETALENLANVGVGNVTVAQAFNNANPPVAITGRFNVTFINKLGEQNVTDLQVTNAVAPAATIAGITQGSDVGFGYTYIDFASEQLQASGVINLDGGVAVGAPVSGTGKCPQTNTFGYHGQSVFIDGNDHLNNGVYAAPIPALIAATRNSPAYKVAVGKTPAPLVVA